MERSAVARRPEEVSRLLADWSNGNETARDELVPLVYDELHRIARRHMARERDGHSLQATVLVNEVYLRLCLLYTSDAADERSSVDLGGRRIIKKKKNQYKIQ